MGDDALRAHFDALDLDSSGFIEAGEQHTANEVNVSMCFRECIAN